MLDLMGEDVNRETPEILIAKLFDTDVTADWLPKNILTSTLFKAPIANFVRRKTDSPIADLVSVIATSLKKEAMAATGADETNLEARQSRLDSGSEGPQSTGTPKANGNIFVQSVKIVLLNSTLLKWCNRLCRGLD